MILGRIILQVGFIFLLTGRLFALGFPLIYSSLVPGLNFYHTYVLAWSKYTVHYKMYISTRYPVWIPRTDNISQLTDKYGAIFQSNFLAIEPLLLLLIHFIVVGSIVYCVKFKNISSRRAINFTLCHTLVPIHPPNSTSWKWFLVSSLIYFTENAALIGSVYVFYGFQFSTFIALLNSDVQESFSGIVKYFYVLFPNGVPEWMIKQDFLIPIFSSTCSALGFLLLIFYYKCCHIWKNVPTTAEEVELNSLELADGDKDNHL